MVEKETDTVSTDTVSTCICLSYCLTVIKQLKYFCKDDDDDDEDADEFSLALPWVM